jgi:hypothetical protein
VNLTLGYSDGYLADPYKRVRFDGYPDPTATFAEKRPGYKFRQIGYFALTQFIEPLNSSVELSYRLYHDSFNITAHTAGLGYYQRIGKHFIVAPMFRYYVQSAADFYGARFAGDPSDPDSPVPVPNYYSADYRLSEMESFTYGVQITCIIKDRVYLDLAYKRYEMIGLDNATSSSAYPTANIITGGLRILW